MEYISALILRHFKYSYCQRYQRQYQRHNVNEMTPLAAIWVYIELF